MKLKKGMPCCICRRALSVFLAVLMAAGLSLAGGVVAQATAAEDLQAAINSLPAGPGNHTAFTWNALVEKKQEAQALLDSGEATDEALEAMLVALNAAYEALANPLPLWALTDAMPTNQAFYSKASFDAMMVVRAQSYQLINSGAGTKESIADMYQMVQAAVAGLVDTQAMRQLQHFTLPIAQGNYTTASWNKLLAARERGQDCIQNGMSQSELEDIIDALNEAWESMADAGALIQQLYNVEAYLPFAWASKSAVTRANVQTLVDQAWVLLETATSQEQIDTALAALETAVDSLIEVGALMSLVNRLPQEQGTYTTATWNAVQAARAQAEDAIANATSDSEVADVEIALDRARVRLVDAAELIDALNALPQEQGLHTDETWLAFQQAKAAAESAIQNATSSAQVDTAKDTLTQKQAALAIEPITTHTPTPLTLQRKTACSTFSAMDTSRVKWYSSDPALLSINEETGAIGKDSYGFARTGDVTITAKIGGEAVKTFSVSVTWSWWQWILVVLLFGWIYL